MHIYTKTTFIWNGTRYIVDKSEGFDYNGTVSLACGATAQQTQIGQSQQNFMNQLQTQAGSVFGSASTVFNNLMNTFMPTVKGGPNAQGFSPGQLATMNSAAINQVGQSYRSAKSAVGNANAAVGGGNTPLPSGATIGTNTELASAAANQTAGELNQITQEGYQAGREEYNTAVAGVEGAPNVFSSATGAGNAATGAGEAAANTANQIAQAQQGPWSLAAGVLGDVAGAATGGWAKNLGSNQNNNTSNSNGATPS